MTTWMIQNTGTETIYVGSQGVTIKNGIPIPGGQTKRVKIRGIVHFAYPPRPPANTGTIKVVDADLRRDS